MKRTITRDLIIFCFLTILFLSLMVGSNKFLWISLLLITTPFILLVIYTICYIRKKVIKPIKYLINEATVISMGNLSRKIISTSNDEIGNFISTFDYMRSVLYKQQKKQEEFEFARKIFIDSISHDLKTPLASISAYIEALQDGVVSTPEETQQYLKIIENKVLSLTELSNQLSRSYETPDTLSLSLEKVNCSNWSVDFLNDMEAECTLKNIEYNFINGISFSEKSNLYIDIHQLDRALLNITSNAFRYYKNHFSISVEVLNGKFIISISNDGVDLSADNLDKLFERFYTEETLHSKGHLGLGLYISKTIVNSMNGEIVVGKKTDVIHFQIILPIF